MPLQRRTRRFPRKQPYRAVARRPVRFYGKGGYTTRTGGATYKNPWILKGRGGYWGDLWNKYRGYIPRAIGTGIGFATGGPAGALMGSLAGAQVSKNVLGWGKYGVQSNTPNLMTAGQVPSVHSNVNSIRFCFREFLQDISTQSTFTNTTFPVNVGLYQTFPFLSALAQNFTQYRLHGLIFQYVPTAGDAVSSTNSALGSVMMAMNYNAIDKAYINEQQISLAMWSSTGKPSEPLTAPIECARNMTSISNLYIRTGSAPANTDLRMYDMGLFQIATMGAQATYTCGKLYVSYDVELFHPQIIDTYGYALETCHLYCTAVDGTHWFGTSQNVYFDSIGMIPVSVNSYKFPTGSEGLYKCDWYITGTTAIIANPSITVTNGTKQKFFVNDTNTLMNVPSQSVSDTQYHLSLIISIPDPTLQCSITFSGGTCPTSATADIFINQMSASMTQ